MDEEDDREEPADVIGWIIWFGFMTVFLVGLAVRG